jgi:hypothetical protein
MLAAQQTQTNFASHQHNNTFKNQAEQVIKLQLHISWLEYDVCKCPQTCRIAI